MSTCRLPSGAVQSTGEECPLLASGRVRQRTAPLDASSANRNEPCCWSQARLTNPSSTMGDAPMPYTLVNGPSGTRQRSWPSAS